jgi:hypothetical protein
MPIRPRSRSKRTRARCGAVVAYVSVSTSTTSSSRTIGTVRRRAWLAMGYGSFRSAWRTLQGIEAVNMIRKGRIWVAKEDPASQARFVGNLFGIAAAHSGRQIRDAQTVSTQEPLVAACNQEINAVDCA